MTYLRVKNWETFQHYKNRLPPWIKLHRTLLDDYDFCQLPDISKAHLMLIWMLSSYSDGRIPNDPKFVADKIGAKSPVNLSLLIKVGWLIPEQIASTALAERYQDASNTLADCKQDASTSLESRAPACSRETETYKEETETETEKENPVARKRADLPSGLPEEVWTDWTEFRSHQKGWTAKGEMLCLRKLAKLQQLGNDPTEVIEQSIANGWKGLFPVNDDRRHSGKQPTLAERRASTVDKITGQDDGRTRTVNGTAERVDQPPVPALPRDLRSQGRSDVGHD